jgi:ABC-2 type transport system permease protein
MPGLSVIIKKEMSDAVSNRTFLLSLGVLIFILLFSGYAAGRQFQLNVSWGNMDTSSPFLTVIAYLVPNINLLGALVAVVYGFNSINKERTEGSLKVMLSYPIFRDQVMLGKLLAGLFIISIVTVVSFTMSLGLFLWFSNILLKPDMILRFSIFTLLTILLLIGWLGISMFLSQVFKDPKTTLLVMFLVVGLLNSNLFSYVGQILSHIVYGSAYFLSNGVVEYNAQLGELSNFINYLPPPMGYQIVSYNVAMPYTYSIVGNQQVLAPNDLWNVFVNFGYSIGLLVVVPILAFVGNYILFTRRDIT